MTIEKSFDERVIDELRANGGKAGGPFAGRPLLVLTTVGAKSGNVRSVPLVYAEANGELLIVGSRGGSPKHPGWYHNLKANPEVTVEVGTEKYRAEAIVTEGEERERLFAIVIEQHPFLGEYREKTPRVIPIVRLRRIAG